MPVILVRPTDEDAADYADNLALHNSRIESIRRIVSPDAVNPLTSNDLPDTFIEDAYYLNEAEALVLKDVGMTASDVDTDDDDFEALVRLVQKRLSILIIPQVAQLLRSTILGNTDQFAEINLQDRIDTIEKSYTNDVKNINPDFETSDIYPVSIVTTNTYNAVDNY